MAELPSKHSLKGLSLSDQKKVIRTEQPSRNRVVSYKLTVRVNEALESHPQSIKTDSTARFSDGTDNSHLPYDVDGDIPMIGMNDEEDVEMVTEYVTRTREDDDWNRIATTTEKATNILNKLVKENISINESRGTSHLVVDTNFMISHLDIVDALTKLYSSYNHKIVIPTTVIKELDGLKGSQRMSTEDKSEGKKTIGVLARWANDWIYRQLAMSSHSVRAQKLYECIDKSAQKDDSILDCCLFLKHKENASLVVLLSNDKNLCMKALGNEILTVSYREEMSAELIAKTIFKENNYITPVPIQPQETTTNFRTFLDNEILSDTSYSNANEQNETYDNRKMDEDIVFDKNSPSHLITVDTLPKAIAIVSTEITKVVIGAIDYCMVEEYGDELDLIVGYEPSKVVNLSSAANVLIKYYISVFTEYFKNSHFKPFEMKGRKNPKYTEVYPDDEVLDVVKFVKYWCDLLRCLYFKRDKVQNEALEKWIERWIGVLRPFV